MLFFWVLASCRLGAKTQKNSIIILTAVKTLNLTYSKVLAHFLLHKFEKHSGTTPLVSSVLMSTTLICIIFIAKYC
jgi:hypothetical protein